jgi:transposase-like protein
MGQYTTECLAKTKEELVGSLDEIARAGARRMLAAALEAEVDEYLRETKGYRDEVGRAMVVRNGHARERSVALSVGPLQVCAPRVDDRRLGEHFTSRILPPYMRRSPRIDEALPILYLKGLSTGDFEEALAALLGPGAAGFSASTITRLLQGWQDEYRAWSQRSLAGTDYVYIWADGLHFQVRLEEDRLACLIIMGVRQDGQKEVIAIEDGYRESVESWSSVLRDLRSRGMAAPVLAVADGALGFWGALREVYPETLEQRCWVHKIRNVLDKLPKRLQARAKEKLHKAMLATNREGAEEAIERFASEYGKDYPKAAACLTDGQEELLTLFQFPQEHWLHLRSTNPIESPFATVKARTRKTKGAGSRKAALALAYKLALAAEGHMRRINAPHLMPLVRAGARLHNGVLAIGSAQPADTISLVPERIAADWMAIHNI